MPRELVTIDLNELKNYILDKISAFSEIQGIYIMEKLYHALGRFESNDWIKKQNSA